MMPLIAHNPLAEIELQANASRVFARGCVAGMAADEERIRETVELSLALATALARLVDCDRAAEVAEEAHRTGRPVCEVASAWEVVPPHELETALDSHRMTGD